MIRGYSTTTPVWYGNPCKPRCNSGCRSASGRRLCLNAVAQNTPRRSGAFHLVLCLLLAAWQLVGEAASDRKAESLSGAGTKAADTGCNRPPQIAAWTSDAGPDDSVFVTGTDFPAAARLRVRPASDDNVRVVPAHWNDDRYLLAVLPADLPQGTLLAAAGREGCWSAEFELNAPQAWWVYPEKPAPGSTARIFGRNLTLASALTLEATNGPVRRLKPVRRTAHWIETQLPVDLPPGRYRLRAEATGLTPEHAENVAVEVAPPIPSPDRILSVTDVPALSRALDELAESGGEIRLDAGDYRLDEALRIPPNVRLQGAGIGKTVLTFGKGVAPTPGLVKPGAPYEQSARLPEPLPGGEGLPAVAGVLMFGSGSAVADLSIDGGGVLEQGVAIAGTRGAPVERITLQGVHIDNMAPFRGTHGQSEAVLARHVRSLEVRDSVLMGQGPALFLEDVADSAVIGNRLAGGGEGVITGREGGVRRTVVEGNRLLSTQDGAVQAVRAIWLSTLFGSTYENYIAENSGANFHPPPGTNQNRGEAILLETALSHPYFGHPEQADSDTVTLPGEGPDWNTLDRDSRLRGTPLTHYFVVILDGTGQGQARRVVAREGATLRLDRPWRVVPTPDSTLVLTELFYRNLIVGNEIRDAMTGIQLWINGVENVIANNRLADTTAEGILLHSAASGGPQTHPRFWPIVGHNLAGFNRGIGVSYFNTVTGNTVRNASVGINLSADIFQATEGPIGWPTSMGNVARRNTIERPRGFALWTGRRGRTAAPFDQAPGFALVGNLIEHDRAQEAPKTYGGDERAAAIALRRNSTGPASDPNLGNRAFPTPTYAKGWLVETQEQGAESAPSREH